MNIKEKTGKISIAANVILTFVKFVVYYYTGSLAILSEAWHSFSDIATSFLVFVSLKKKPDVGADEEKQNFIEKLTAEEKASLVIASILFFVSLTLFRNIFYLGPVKVSNPLLAGVMFFVFGLSSYMIYKFETNVGHKEDSVGLTSDGLHSKSDMLSSFLTGGSLVAYHMGLDIDKLVSLLISILIFLLSIEIFATVLWGLWNKDKQDKMPDKVRLGFKTYKIIFSLFDSGLWLQMDDYINEKLGFRFSESAIFKFVIKNSGRAILLFLLLYYFSTCFFTVLPGEKTLVERCGRLVGEPLGSGLHFKLPWPFDIAHPVNIKVRELKISNAADLSRALIWTRSHGDGRPFLSGDNNFVYPYFTLFYRIKNVKNYYNMHSSPELMLKDVCLRTVTDVFAVTPLSDLFTSSRKNILNEIKLRLQRHLDSIKSGIYISDVCLKDIHPPISVASSFESVIAALQTKQTLILKALSYKNSEIPGARARASKYVNEAESYNYKQIYKARGKAKRFQLTENAFCETKNITELRLYLEAMEKSLKQCKIILVDKKLKQPSLFIDSKKISPFSTDFGSGQPLVEEDSLPAPDKSGVSLIK